MKKTNYELINHVEQLIKKIKIHDQVVDFNEIIKLNLDYNTELFFIDYLESKGIEVIFNISKDDNKDNFDTSAELFLNNINKTKILTKEEEYDLACKYYYDKDLSARDKLIIHNLRMVVSIAKEHIYNGVTFEDLIQSGNEGLIKAVDRYVPSKEIKFSTYAYYWIKQTVYLALNNESRVIRIPVGLSNKMRKINYYYNEYFNLYGEKASDEYIKQRVEISDRDLYFVKYYLDGITSLNNPIVKNGDEQKGCAIIDLIPDDNSLICDIIDEKNLRKDLELALQHLSEREREILKMRFALPPYNKVYTLHELSKKYGLTRERIRQIEFKAMRDIKKSAYAQNLKSYIR